MQKLNSKQQAAVNYIDGPLLVLAGAGSGKTRVITSKIAHLVKNHFALPEKITAVTFTNKAARSMKSRLGNNLDKSAVKNVSISTFHTLGLKIIKQELSVLGYKPGFSIYDSQDSISLIKEILRQETFSNDLKVEAIQWQISSWKNKLILPDEALQSAQTNPLAVISACVYKKYQKQMKIYNAMDLDDLLLLPVILFQTQAELLSRWQNNIRYMLIDEYQDTNATQYELVKLLVGNSGNLTAVGDDDQSIYSWRGAQPENLSMLKTDFPNLKVEKLEQNYRSMGYILKAANKLIANNPHLFEKALWSEFGVGDRLLVLTARDEEHEAERVVSEILHHKFKFNKQFNAYAILYRGNHQARVFEKILREQQIPYYLSGGTSFFSYTEVKDLLCYLRLLANPDDDNAFLRIINTPRREIGPSTVEKLAIHATECGSSLFATVSRIDTQTRLNTRAYQRLNEFCNWIQTLCDKARQLGVTQAFRILIQDVDYQDWLQNTSTNEAAAIRRWKNVQELASWIERITRLNKVGDDLAEVVAHITLMDILERQDDDTDNRVHLMTLHAAKGLEFPHVYIVGMEEGILPHKNSIETGQLEEERRLAYVGITRAQRSLTFSYAERRKQQGEMRKTAPSRFLDELPKDVLIWESERDTLNPEEKQQRGQAHLANLRGLLANN